MPGPSLGTMEGDNATVYKNFGHGAAGLLPGEGDAPPPQDRRRDGPGAFPYGGPSGKVRGKRVPPPSLSLRAPRPHRVRRPRVLRLGRQWVRAVDPPSTSLRLEKCGIDFNVNTCRILRLVKEVNMWAQYMEDWEKAKEEAQLKNKDSSDNESKKHKSTCEKDD